MCGFLGKHAGGRVISPVLGFLEFGKIGANGIEARHLHRQPVAVGIKVPQVMGMLEAGVEVEGDVLVGELRGRKETEKGRRPSVTHPNSGINRSPGRAGPVPAIRIGWWRAFDHKGVELRDPGLGVALVLCRPVSIAEVGPK